MFALRPTWSCFGVKTKISDLTFKIKIFMQHIQLQEQIIAAILY